MSYDSSGNLTAVLLPGGQTHRFTYDVAGLAIEYTPPAVGDGARPLGTVFGVDGRVLVRRLEDGDSLVFAYDGAGRLSGRQSSADDVVIGYDPVTGQRTRYDGSNGVSVQLQYDGPLPTRTTWTGPITGSVSHTYDSFHGIMAEAVNNEAIVGHSYDPDGRLASAGAMSFAHHPAHGLLMGDSLGQVVSRFSRNALAAVTTAVTLFSGDTIFFQTYQRDSLERVTVLDEQVSGQTTRLEYGYDENGRLTNVARNGQVEAVYDYDPNGNLLSVTTEQGGQAGTYDARDRLVSLGVRQLGYTPDGFLRFQAEGGDTTWYTHAPTGELLAVGLPGGDQVEYVVDPLGRRIGRKLNGTLARQWLYAGPVEIAAELDSLGGIISRFVYGAVPGVPVYMERGGRTYRLVTDQIGSVRLVVDIVTGEVAQRLDYDPYGQVLLDTRPGFQPFGFASGLLDAATGLVHFGARDYAPALRRWIARDPLLFAGGDVNLYGYATSDPVNRRDITGQFTIPELQISEKERGKLKDSEVRRFQQRLKELRKRVCQLTDRLAERGENLERALGGFHEHHAAPRTIF